MNIVVLNTKILKRDGSMQPVRYEDATYSIQESVLKIIYREGSQQKVAKIPLSNVATIIEEEAPTQKSN